MQYQKTYYIKVRSTDLILFLVFPTMLTYLLHQLKVSVLVLCCL